VRDDEVASKHAEAVAKPRPAGGSRPRRSVGGIASSSPSIIAPALEPASRGHRGCGATSSQRASGEDLIACCGRPPERSRPATSRHSARSTFASRASSRRSTHHGTIAPRAAKCALRARPSSGVCPRSPAAWARSGRGARFGDAREDLPIRCPSPGWNFARTTRISPAAVQLRLNSTAFAVEALYMRSKLRPAPL